MARRSGSRRASPLIGEDNAEILCGELPLPPGDLTVGEQHDPAHRPNRLYRHVFRRHSEGRNANVRRSGGLTSDLAWAGVTKGEAQKADRFWPDAALRRAAGGPSLT
jgi:hypothetical protein